MKRHLIAGLALAALALPAQAFEIEEIVSPAGIEIWHVRDDSVPLISMEAAFRGGANGDGAETAGLARFASAMLSEGAGDLDSQAFKRRVEDLALRLRFDVDRQAMTVGASSLRDVADESFALIGLALSQPRFEESAIERTRRRMIARLRGEETDPGAIAAQALRVARYGDHPLGRPVQGALDTVPRIGAADLEGFAAAHLARDRLLVATVGAVDAARAAALVDRAFAGLPAEGQGDWRMPPVTPGGQGEVIVSRVAAPQSQGYFAQPGLNRDDPDWHAAVLVNHVLGGGGFASRLVDEVREKRGLAYSVYSTLIDYPAGPMIFGSVATENARFAESWAVIQAEWARMGAEGPTAEELADAKANVIGGFPLRLTSTRRIAGVVLDLQRDGLGRDYLDRRAALFDAVTREDAARVAARLFDPAKLTLSVAGAPEGLPGSDG